MNALETLVDAKSHNDSVRDRVTRNLYMCVQKTKVKMQLIIDIKISSFFQFYFIAFPLKFTSFFVSVLHNLISISSSSFYSTGKNHMKFIVRLVMNSNAEFNFFVIK